MTKEEDCRFEIHGHGYVFFAVCPYTILDCKVPKNGMNCTNSLSVVCGVDSSRFSGQLSKHHRGIEKKDATIPVYQVSARFKELK
jgi:hypothetical protein